MQDFRSQALKEVQLLTGVQNHLSMNSHIEPQAVFCWGNMRIIMYSHLFLSQVDLFHVDLIIFKKVFSLPKILEL